MMAEDGMVDVHVRPADVHRLRVGIGMSGLQDLCTSANECGGDTCECECLELHVIFSLSLMVLQLFTDELLYF